MFAIAPWLLIAVPAAVALLLGAGSRRLSPVAPVLALGGPVLTAAVGLTGALSLRVGGASTTLAEGSVKWFSAGRALLHLTWRLDALAAVMLAVVGVVAVCVVVFSVGYMRGDSGWVRYFALLSLFTASMNLLVIADSFPAVFMGWELVGACSYLLIGFWYQRPAASAAAVKAFLTTRVGDVGLLVGIAILWSATGAATYAGAAQGIATVPTGILTAAAIGIALGAIGKSAQFPLHAWLPDAMEGPTPVSALIHAATMVAAGVYLVVRLSWLFEAAPNARLVLLACGAVSALGAALAAVAQRDIKKMLAYSTVSQLGFMFVALGAGAWFAAFFHLVTHAAFKGLLFLTSGSVIHGTGTQDMREMGGLRKTMPYTFVAWLVGVFALSGIPGFAGFFSKDLIIETVWAQSPALAVMLLAAATLTAFYCARSTRLVFFGEPADGLHAHESGSLMVLPLSVLGACAVGLGWLETPLAALLGHEGEPTTLAITAAAVIVVALGGAIGWLASAGPAGDRRTERSLGGLWTLLARAFGWNEFVDAAVVRPTVAASRTLWAVGDRFLADGFVEGAASVARSAGNALSRLQDGDGQSYAVAISVGFVLMLVISVWAGR